MREWLSGGAPPCQGGGRGFDPRLALFKTLDFSRVFLFHVAFHVAQSYFLLYIPSVNGKLEWKRLGTKVGTDGIDIPQNANEICINVYLADSDYPQYYKTIPIDLVGVAASNVVIDSTYYSSTEYVYITARMNKTYVSLRLVYVNGKNVTNTTNMVVSYR